MCVCVCRGSVAEVTEIRLGWLIRGFNGGGGTEALTLDMSFDRVCSVDLSTGWVCIFFVFDPSTNGLRSGRASLLVIRSGGFFLVF